MTASAQPAARPRHRRILLLVLVLVAAVVLAPELLLLLARCWLPLAIDGPEAGATILTTSPWGSSGHDISLELTPGQACTLIAGASGRRIPFLPLYPGMSVGGELRLRRSGPTEAPMLSAAAPGAAAMPAAPAIVRLSAQLRLRLLGAHPQLRLHLSPASADALLATVLHLRLGLMVLTIHPQAAVIEPSAPPAGESCAVHFLLSGHLDLDVGSATEQVVVDCLAGTLSAHVIASNAGLQPVLRAHLEAIQVEGPDAATLNSDLTRQQIEDLLNASLASSLADTRLPTWVPTDCQVTGHIAPPSAP